MTKRPALILPAVLAGLVLLVLAALYFVGRRARCRASSPATRPAPPATTSSTGSPRCCSDRVLRVRVVQSAAPDTGTSPSAAGRIRGRRLNSASRLPCPSVCGGSEPRQAERVLDRAQHPVVVERASCAGAAAHERAGDDGGDLPARGPAAAAAVGRSLVPREHEVALRAEGAQQERHAAGEEAVAGRHVAVVHVVAEVRRDEDVRRQPAAPSGPRRAGRRARSAGSAAGCRRRRRSRRTGCASWRSRRNPLRGSTASACPPCRPST